MNWIVIATIAYFLFALASVADKFLVSKKLKPKVYAFFIAVLGGVISIILIPFGFEWLGWKLLVIDFISGITFIIALIFLFTALQKKESSRIFPLAGGMQPIIILFLALLILSEKFTATSIVAFAFIVMGSFVISFSAGKEKIGRPAIYFVVLASIFFGLSFVLEKLVYLNHPFISGFVWNRIGNFIMGVMLFMHAPTRKEILKIVSKKPKISTKNSTLKAFFLGQTAGSIGAFLQRYAISMGSVTIVSALQGMHYVFLLILTSILSLKFPKILKEKVTKKIFIQKIIAIALISLGVLILTLS